MFSAFLLPESEHQTKWNTTNGTEKVKAKIFSSLRRRALRVPHKFIISFRHKYRQHLSSFGIFYCITRKYLFNISPFGSLIVACTQRHSRTVRGKCERSLLDNWIAIIIEAARHKIQWHTPSSAIATVSSESLRNTNERGMKLNCNLLSRSTIASASCDCIIAICYAVSNRCMTDKQTSTAWAHASRAHQL